MIKTPYLLFTGDATDDGDAKTAFGLRDWVPDAVVGQWRLAGGSVDLGLPMLDPAAAFAAGARSMVVGIAPVGGALPPAWQPTLLAALAAGLDLVSGLHTRLRDLPLLVEAAARLGRELHDVRHAARAFPAGTGARRPGRRLLAVGTDCALGKKYTALALARGLQARGHAADFRATGQTGIMIAGDGVAIDAVVADFIAGAAETLSPAAPPEHWDVIEGQGSLFHPAYAGVTLGLLHGSQPDALVLCHDPLRTHVGDAPWITIPPLDEAMRRYLEAAVLTNPAARFVAISLNTSKLDEAAAHAIAAQTATAHGLPVFDPLRFGIDAVLDHIEAGFGRPA
jgi:uncharacterized NAD-dependent epimerase/dehydratase family protein